MVQIGPYLLMGVITVFGLGIFVLIGFMLKSASDERKAQQVARETPRADTLADQIEKQFKVEDERKERFIHTKSGVSKVKFEQTKSAFSFKEDDADSNISLESNYDNGPETPLLSPDEKI